MKSVLPKIVSKKELGNMYDNEKFSIREIAEKLGVDKHTIIYWMDKWGINRRSVSKGLRLRWQKDVEYRDKQTKRLLQQGFQKGDIPWWKQQGKPNPSTLQVVRQKISEAHKKIVGFKHPNWKGGYEPYYGADWCKQRRKALERDNFSCQRCGATREDFGQEPHVHHIIPYRISEDNSLDNLITLCPSCHSSIEARISL